MLTRIAWRLAAVEALKGFTQVGDHVLDSRIDALDVDANSNLEMNEQKPFIAVYTDSSKAEVGMEMRNLRVAGSVDLVLEYGVTAAMGINNPDSDESEIIVGIPATDPALEFFLDLVGFEITAALLNADNAWAEIWRGLSTGVVKIERLRTADAATGVRMAAHQLLITAELLPDPVAGEELRPTSGLAGFFERALAADGTLLKTQAELMKAAIAGTVPDLTAIRSRYGLTGAEAEALQLGPEFEGVDTISGVVVNAP